MGLRLPLTPTALALADSDGDGPSLLLVQWRRQRPLQVPALPDDATMMPSGLAQQRFRRRPPPPSALPNGDQTETSCLVFVHADQNSTPGPGNIPRGLYNIVPEMLSFICFVRLSDDVLLLWLFLRLSHLHINNLFLVYRIECLLVNLGCFRCGLSTMMMYFHGARTGQFQGSYLFASWHYRRLVTCKDIAVAWCRPLDTQSVSHLHFFASSA